MSLKRWLLLLGTLCVLLACAPAGLSQETVVSGQVLAPDGFAYQAGTGNFAIQCAGNSQPYINGSPVSRNIPLVRLSGTGAFSQALWDTSFLTDVNNQPLSCQWQANFLDNCGVATFGVLFTGITGSAVTVTSQISAVSVPLSAACTPPGTLDSVTLGDLPPLFTVTQSGTATNPVFNFVPDTVGNNLVLAGPAGGVVNTSANTSGTDASPTATVTSTVTSGNVLFIGTVSFGTQGGNFPTPGTPASGWTVIDQNSVFGVFSHSVTATGPFTATSTLSPGAPWVSSLYLTGTSSAVTLVQLKGINSGAVGNTTSTGTFTSPVTVGNTLAVIVSSGLSSGSPACSAQDSLGNPYQPQAPNIGTTVAQFVYLAPVMFGGSDTVQVVCATSGGNLLAGIIDAYELHGIAGVPGSYSFRSLVGGDLPFPTISSLGGVDAYTAPTHQFLTAINANGTVSSAQPTGADITGVVTSVTGTANEITASGTSAVTLSIPSTFIAPGSIKSTTSLTAGNLSTGQCVQTSTGGLLTGAGAPCLTSAGFTQIQAVASGTPCTPPSANSFDACAFTVTWPTSFADAVYIPSCWLLEPAANGGNSSTNTANIIYLASKTAADMSVIVQNARGAQNTPNQVYCIGIHP